MKQTKQTHELYIERTLAVACINADTSGLNEEDLEALESDDLNGHVVILSDEIEFRVCDVTGYAADCALISVEVYS